MSARERRRKAKRMGRRTAAGAGAVLGATLVATGGAQAADFTVTNLDASGAGSLRDAIDQANLNAGPDRVLFQSGLSGTIHLNDPVSTGPLYVSEALEVQGPGADVLTVSGDDDSQVFFVSAPGGDDVTISGLKVTQGTAKYGGPGAPAGGDIASPNGANLTVSASEIRSGVGIVGGGIYSDGPLTVQNSTVSGNLANFLGGGIFVTGYGTGPEPPLVSISGSTINNNSVGTKYGGFFTAQATEPTSRQGGGGGAALRGNVVIENSTFTGNAATAQGGAILNGNYANPDQTLTVRSTTISGNEAGAGGGIYSPTYQGTGTAPPNPVIENSIIAGNRADGPQHGPDLGGGPFDAAFTLVQDPSSIAINQTVAGSNIIGLDPLLGELSANGGQTRTMALLDGSPALDNGRTPAGETADQRGSARPSDLPAYPNSGAAGADGADIGAFERLGPPPPSGTCQGKPATLSGTDERDILNGTPGDDVIVGNGGNDAIRGFGGDDLICAGGGLDQVTGGEGNDRIIGEGENDRIYGQKGNDTLIDAPGADLLSGGIGNDVLKGGGNEDRLLGAAGNDRLFGQADDDVLLGAKGNDFLRGGPGKDRLSGGVGANDVQQ